MTTSLTLEELARLAIDGDRGALDLVVRELQPDLYGLALSMLWNKEDAEDATQEILVRVVTRLSQFDFRSRLKTWAYRVAVNYILDVKKSAIERLHLTFERFGDNLANTLDVECRRRRAVAAHRGSQSRLHAGDAAMSRPAAPAGVCAGRNHGARGARGGRRPGDLACAVSQTAAARPRGRPDVYQVTLRAGGGRCAVPLQSPNLTGCDRGPRRRPATAIWAARHVIHRSAGHGPARRGSPVGDGSTPEQPAARVFSRFRAASAPRHRPAARCRITFVTSAPPLPTSRADISRRCCRTPRPDSGFHTRLLRLVQSCEKSLAATPPRR